MIETDSAVARPRLLRLCLGGAAAVVLIPVLAGFGLSRVGPLQGVGTVLMVTPVVTVPVLVPALALFVVALRRGRAGWLTALLTGAGAGIVAAWVIGGGPSLTAVPRGALQGTVFAGLFWLGARLAAPEALGAPK